MTEFDQRFVLEFPQHVDDGSGGRIETWQALATVWVKISPRSGVEAPVAQSLRSELTHEVVVRYRGELRPAMRLTAANRILEITAIFDGARPMRWPVCQCREVPLQ